MPLRQTRNQILSPPSYCENFNSIGGVADTFGDGFTKKKKMEKKKEKEPATAEAAAVAAACLFKAPAAGISAVKLRSFA